MSDISTITVNNQTYNLKDSDARLNKADIIKTSIGGEVASFNDGGPYSAENMIIEINPNQDLNDYDYAYSPGCGKNLLPITINTLKDANTSGTWNGDVYTKNGVTFTFIFNSEGYLLKIIANGKATGGIADCAFGLFTIPKGNYKITGCPLNGSTSRYWIGSSSNKFGNEVGNGIDFNPTSDFSFTSGEGVRIANNYTVVNLIFQPMLRLATETNTKFAPYSNVCQILPRNEINIYNDHSYGGYINWNQLIPNGNFTENGGWYGTYGSIEISNGEISYTVTTKSSGNANRFSSTGTINTINIIKDHKYYISGYFKVPRSTTISLAGYSGNSAATTFGELKKTISANTWERVSFWFNGANSGVTELRVGFYSVSATQVGDISYAKNIFMVDLTQVFGSEKEPITIEEFESIFPLDYYPYTTGIKTWANAVNELPYEMYTIALGENIYGGKYNSETGELISNRILYRLGRLTDINIASSNYIKSDSVNGFVVLDPAPFGNYDPGHLPYELYCNRLKFEKSAIWSTVGYPNTITINQNQLHINISNQLLGITDPTQETISSAKTKLLAYLNNLYDNGNYIEVSYEISPSTSQISLLKIQTVQGYNGIWSDAGKINFTYKADTKPYVNKGKIYYVKGTQTTATNVWTGNLLDVEELYEGLAINYWLPVAGTGSGATLNLKLKSGLETGPIPVFYGGTTRQTTHLPATYVGQFIYQTVNISGNIYTGWWMLRAYLDGNTTDIVNLYDGTTNYIADSKVYRYELLFTINDNILTPLNNEDNKYNITTKVMLTDTAFNAFKPIYYWSSTSVINANAALAGTALYYHRNTVDLRYTFNCAQTLTANKEFYLKVVPQGNGMVKIATDPCWVQDLPSSDDGNWYIFLGRTQDTYRFALYTEHPVYDWIDGGWKQIFDPNLALATASSAGLMSAADKTKLDGIDPSGGDYQLPIASSTTLGGIKVGNNLNIDGNGILSANNTDTKYTATTTSIGSASAGTAIKANNITAWSTGTLPTLGTNIPADDITSWSTGTLPKLGTAIAADDITSWTTGSLPTLGTAIPADDITSWTTGSLPTLGTSIPTDDITSWSTGTLPTLGSAISADDITSWSTGTLPTLGTAIPADDITSWTTGTLPTLGTAIAADDITSWSTGTLPTASVEDEILTLTFGTLPALAYTSRSIPNVTGVGTLPNLEYTSKSIPNVTGVGTLPALGYTSRSIPNVTSVGTLPTLEYTPKNVPNVTNVGTLPSLEYSSKSIPNVTSVGTLPSLEYTSRSIPNVTSVGTLPDLQYTSKSIPNVTGVGTLPALTHSEKTIPNITVTAKTVVTEITES